MIINVRGGNKKFQELLKNVFKVQGDTKKIGTFENPNKN
jgi:hypothetical protein